MNWISIDPGQNLGWALWDGEKLISHGVQKTRPGISDRTRKKELDRWFYSVMKNEKPGLVVMEYQVMSRFFSKAILDLNLKAGGYITLANLFGVEVFEVNPSEVKKIVTGNGRADKKQVREAVNLAYGLQVEDTNESDAIGIGMAYLEMAEEVRR